jgi:plasmid stabilization system protein ParE
MAYEITWLPKAEQRYDEIIDWLSTHWTDKEIYNFMKRTHEVLGFISTNPELYRKSGKGKIHEAVITKHTLLLYRKKGNKVELLTFFDTRQNPNKKFK